MAAKNKEQGTEHRRWGDKDTVGVGSLDCGATGPLYHSRTEIAQNFPKIPPPEGAMPSRLALCWAERHAMGVPVW